MFNLIGSLSTATLLFLCVLPLIVGQFTVRAPMLPVGKQKPFAERMGFANQSHPSGEGIVADWSVLPVETKAVRRGWTFVGSGISPITDLGGGGDAMWNYAWKEEKGRTLSIHVVVFNKGQPAAVEKMDRVGNGSNMPVNPFGPAPDKMKLGDWTAMPYPEQANKRGRTHSVFWVYRNVFAHVRMTDGEGANALPIARAIQAFMEKHQVDDLSAHLPKVSDLRIVPRRVSVGETFRTEVIGALNTDWQISVQDLEGGVECEAREGLSSTWEAVDAGRAVFEAVIMDKKSLLSATRRASVEVAPITK